MPLDVVPSQEFLSTCVSLPFLSNIFSVEKHPKLLANLKKSSLSSSGKSSSISLIFGISFLKNLKSLFSVNDLVFPLSTNAKPYT